ncbi:hypothetical protein BGW80DRAFT_1391272 [Lactifluus volemus]|nr:hypothetical protein BGW80DRAFT_1391272 [Lactifluus volemus]
MTILRLMIRHFCPYSFLPLFSCLCIPIWLVSTAYFCKSHVRFYLFEPNKTAAKQTTWRAYNFTHLLAFVMKTATGIFLPTSATSSPLPEATVIAVGPGAPDKEGRIVPRNAIKVGEDEYHLFKDSEILAKIEE